MSTCERCGKEKPVFTYKPNLGKHPGKTVQICEQCKTDKDIIDTIANDTVLPTDDNVIETVEFGPPKEPSPVEEPLNTDGAPVSRKDIALQMEERKKTVVKAKAELQKLQKASDDLIRVIQNNNGAIAQLAAFLK